MKRETKKPDMGAYEESRAPFDEVLRALLKAKPKHKKAKPKRRK